MLQNEFTKETYLQLRSAYVDSVTELEKAREEIASLTARMAALEAEVRQLQEQLKLSQSRRFGKKNEKHVPEEKDALEAQNELQSVAGYTRRKKGIKSCGRSLDTSNLPRHKIVHDLADAEKNCPCCQKPLEYMDQEFTEQVEVLPSQLYVAEHIRYKYVCRGCEKIIMAPKEKSALPKAIAGNSLLTEIIVNKYQYHLPLYRQSKILLSFGANIPDNTLSNWVLKVGFALEKIYEALIKIILSTSYLQVDETPIKILKPDKKGYLWSYFAPKLRLVFFELSLTRSALVAELRLSDFCGLLQTDAYKGYQNLRDREGIVGLGCMSHARRKFVEVLKIAKNSSGIAKEVLERLKPLYALEERMRSNNLSPHTRKRLRQKIAWPILKELHHFLKISKPKVPPRSQLANAIGYTLKQWRYLILYTRHGTAEIDTNWVENQIRPVAVGRRNWLFMSNEDNGKVHAIFYSLVSSCLLNDLNPRLYFHYLISKVHELRRGELDPSILLPHNIDRTQLKIFAKNFVAQSKKILDASS